MISFPLSAIYMVRTPITSGTFSLTYDPRVVYHKNQSQPLRRWAGSYQHFTKLLRVPPVPMASHFIFSKSQIPYKVLWNGLLLCLWPNLNHCLFTHTTKAILSTPVLVASRKCQSKQNKTKNKAQKTLAKTSRNWICQHLWIYFSLSLATQTFQKSWLRFAFVFQILLNASFRQPNRKGILGNVVLIYPSAKMKKPP